MSGLFLFVHVNEWAPVVSPDTIPISMGYILAELQARGFDGTILGDYKDRPLDGYQFRTTIEQLQPACIGFTTYEENIDRVRFWARFAKFLKPDIVTILGGPQATFMPAAALSEMAEIDLLCRGDGEIVMAQLAEALAGNSQLSSVPGICHAPPGSVPRETGRPILPEDLDILRSPYLDDILEVQGKQRAILFSSRGCTGNCSFCYTPKACNRTMQFHSVERVVEEMRYLKQKGTRDFWFADPNFASSKERLEAICRGIIDGVSDIGFWCQGRYNLLDWELIRLLKRAGAHTIAFGLESSDVYTLKKLKKGVDPNRLAATIAMARTEGLNVELFSLYGLPGDTFESSLATLHYVEENQVPVEGNSISQQLHLFFGTPVAEQPERHNIIVGNATRASYHSAERDFHTGRMTEDDIQNMSLLWRLHRTDFQEHVANGHDIFTVAGFITRNFDQLAHSPLRDTLLYQIYRSLDEPAAAADCLIRLRADWRDHPVCRPILDEQLIGYSCRRRARADKGCRVIFDCKGVVNGQVLPATEDYYQIAVLGDGTLLPSFEQGLIGLKAGSATQFDVRFPDDYGNPDLAGRTVPFQVYLHQVLHPVTFASPEEMRQNSSRNMYRFSELFQLKKYNERLYYMTLRDSVLNSMNGNLNDMLALFDYSLKLGFFEKAMDLAYDLPDEPSIQGHLGRMLQVNDYAEEALVFLEKARDTNAETENQRIRALIKLQRFEEAESTAANPKLATSLETLKLKVQLAAQGELPLNAYLARMDNFLDTHVQVANGQSY